MRLSSVEHWTIRFTLISFLLYYGNADNSHNAKPSVRNPRPATISRAPSQLQNKGSGGSCYKGDLVCEKDKLGYEAIATLHQQMDDDNNGDIDLEESAEFLLEELHYTKSHLSDHRSKTFHMNDTHITVDDLWMIWKNSSVHNWTIEQVVNWLSYDVELPQYAETFKINAVDGSTLPRLAVNNLNFVSNILGIKNLLHKQQLANKATDVVLFGPPKFRHNWYKDVVLVLAIVIAIGGCWFAYRQHKRLEINMARTMRDMDSLAKSEEALKQLQQKLEREEMDKRHHIKHQEQLEEKRKQEISEARLEAHKLKLTKEQTEVQLSRMQEMSSELERTKQSLIIAQKELEVRSSLAPSLELQRWLQITFELELKVYNDKKALAEQQLVNAKESCERLRKKKQAFLGSLRMAHTSFIDETESIIITAKKALEEIKHDLAERQYRWQQIENMCTFSIISNPGIKALIQSTGHTDLYRYCHGGGLLEMAAASDLDDLEDMPPTYGAVVAALSSNGYNLTKQRRSHDSVVSKGGSFLPTNLPGPSTSRSLGSGISINKLNVRGSSPSSSRPSSVVDGASSSAAGGPGDASLAAVKPPVSEEQSVNTDEDHRQRRDIDDLGSSHESDHGAGATGQPHFTLYEDDQESTSSSSNDNNSTHIPNRARRPLQRHDPVRQPTDAMSVTSECVASSSSVVENPARLRSHTNESQAVLFRQRRARTSPLATNGLSNSESMIVSRGNTTQVRRSRTTDSNMENVKGLVISVSQDFVSVKPESAPASLVGTRDNDSDTSASSGSKEGESGRKKTKRKLQIFNKFMFRNKQRSS